MFLVFYIFERYVIDFKNLIITNQIIGRTLKIKLNDAYRSVNYSQQQIFQLRRQILRHVPANICYSFFNKQEATFRFHLKHEHDKLNQKLDWLVLKNDRRMLKKIKPINYYCSYTSREDTSCKTEFSIQPSTNTSQLRSIEVFVYPKTFIDQVNNSSLANIRDKWMLNLSSINIPNEIQTLLQFGENFSLLVYDRKNVILEHIKNIENNLHKMSPDQRLNIRNLSIPLIINIFSPPQLNNATTNTFSFLTKITKRFIQNNPRFNFH